MKQAYINVLLQVEVDIVFIAGPTSAARFRRAASSFDLVITTSVDRSNDAR